MHSKEVMLIGLRYYAPVSCDLDPLPLHRLTSLLTWKQNGTRTKETKEVNHSHHAHWPDLSNKTRGSTWITDRSKSPSTQAYPTESILSGYQSNRHFRDRVEYQNWKAVCTESGGSRSMPDCIGNRIPSGQYNCSWLSGDRANNRRGIIKTNLLPRHDLGPRRNGWRTSLLSDSNLGSVSVSVPSQRSGMKWLGRAKLDDEW